jgi:hypothetical protein
MNCAIAILVYLAAGILSAELVAKRQPSESDRYRAGAYLGAVFLWPAGVALAVMRAHKSR